MLVLFMIPLSMNYSHKPEQTKFNRKTGLQMFRVPWVEIVELMNLHVFRDKVTELCFTISPNNFLVELW